MSNESKSSEEPLSVKTNVFLLLAFYCVIISNEIIIIRIYIEMYASLKINNDNFQKTDIELTIDIDRVRFTPVPNIVFMKIFE